MRANEFVSESKKGKISTRQQQSTRGLNIFADNQFDRQYDLNRVMMAVACSDGVLNTKCPITNRYSHI